MTSHSIKSSSFSTAASQLTSSPISMLNYDVLSLIFMTNTNIDGYFDGFTVEPFVTDVHPLDTARHTSQVCQKWREIVTESPSIWANIIELGLLVQRTAHWRNLVLSRAGSANLCISGWVDWDDILSASIFKDLMAGHWKCIRKIDVEFRNGMPERFLAEASEPAPNLEHLCFWSVKKHEVSKSNQSEDNCDATFKVITTREPLLPCVNAASYPWIPQLRSLIIPSSVSMKDLFSLLTGMPVLESLVIEPHKQAPSQEEQNSDLKQAFLPRLRLLDIRKSRFETCLYILEHITPAPQCVLRLSSYDHKPQQMTNDENHIASFGTILKQYSMSYFNSREISRLDLSLSQNRISVGVPCHDLPSTQSFEVLVRPSYNLPLSISSSVLDSFSSSQLSSIKTLDLEISDEVEHSSLKREFMTFASSCPNVEVMSVDKAAAEVFCDLMGEHPTVFPKLQTLNIKEGDYSDAEVRVYATIMSILAFRHNDSIPSELPNSGSLGGSHHKRSQASLTVTGAETITKMPERSLPQRGKRSFKRLLFLWKRIKSKLAHPQLE